MRVSARSAILALVCGFIAAASWGGAAGAADANTTPRQQIESIIHDYLMQHPDVLIAALREAEDKLHHEDEAKASQAVIQHRREVFNDPATPVAGNPQGDVAVVEFFDYRCPYCKVTAPTLQTLITQDPKVRVVMKEFPILGKESVFASRVALVAQKHGKYAEFHQAMFALKTKVDDAQTLEVAKSIGLDPAQVKKEAEASDIDAILKHNYELAKTLDVSGTPAFVIGDTLLPGAVELKDFQAAIAAARKG